MVHAIHYPSLHGNDNAVWDRCGNDAQSSTQTALHRIGLIGSHLVDGNFDDDIGIVTLLPNPTPLREESFSRSTPRRVSLTQEDKLQLASLLPSKKTKMKKTVRFVQEHKNKIIETNAGETKSQPWKFTKEHKRELWYQRDEIGAMRTEATNILRATMDMEFCSKSDEDDAMIGLYRYRKPRSKRRKMAIRSILRAQAKLCLLPGWERPLYHSMEDFLRGVSERCTKWARNVAQQQGFRDYCAVHDPLAALFSDNLAENLAALSKTPLETKGKENQGPEPNYNALLFGEPSLPTRLCEETIKKRRTGTECYDTTSRFQHESKRRRMALIF